MLSLVAVETVFTVSEVARLLRVLEGRFALTARGVRYFARTGMVVPSGRMRASSEARATRLYTAVDVALLRLVCRLRRQHVHERALWGLLVYRGDELRRMLADGRGEIVVTDRAELGIGSEDAVSPKPIHVDVSSLTHGLSERLEAFRQRRPNIWTGLAWMSANEAAEQISA
jgi:hypothetical protein